MVNSSDSQLQKSDNKKVVSLIVDKEKLDWLKKYKTNLSRVAKAQIKQRIKSYWTSDK